MDDNDNLIGDTDALHWARAFLRTIELNPYIVIDENLMTTWFACAIESGRMAAENTAPHESLGEVWTPVGIGWPE